MSRAANAGRSTPFNPNREGRCEQTGVSAWYQRGSRVESRPQAGRSNDRTMFGWLLAWASIAWAAFLTIVLALRFAVSEA